MAKNDHQVVEKLAGAAELETPAAISQREVLCNIPLGLSYLGQLNLIGTCKDFPLMQNEQKPFSILRHPESFRASLTQVSNLGVDAFLKAHSGMEAISMKTKLVPGYIEEVNEIVEEGEPEDYEDIPNVLKVTTSYLSLILTSCFFT